MKKIHSRIYCKRNSKKSIVKRFCKMKIHLKTLQKQKLQRQRLSTSRLIYQPSISKRSEKTLWTKILQKKHLKSSVKDVTAIKLKDFPINGLKNVWWWPWRSNFFEGLHLPFHWIDQINWGRLMKVTDNFYAFIKLMENLARVILNKDTLVRYCGGDLL